MHSSTDENQWLTFEREAPIAIIGAGVMGTKVAWACARAGIPTRLFDLDVRVCNHAVSQALSWSQGEERNRVEHHLRAEADLRQAVDGVHFAFENVPENLDLKKKVLREVSVLLKPTAYLGSNSSSFLCTPLALASGRASRFFNMNFTDPRYSKLVELMGSELTATETVTFAERWAACIGMVVIKTRKEQIGYSFNRLWRVVKKETLRQLDEGIATQQDIDRAWMLTFGMEQGPCGIMDEIGLATVLSIEQSYFEESGDESDRPRELLKSMVARGELGKATGKGFYSYPDPEYRDAAFLSTGSGVA